MEPSSIHTDTVTKVPHRNFLQQATRPAAAMSSGSTTTAVAGADSAPHFVLVPMMAAGHAGPMLDMARTLSSRGALVTFVTTPLNLPRISRLPRDDDALPIPIRFLPLRFPCAEAGLPEGCESLDSLPGLGLLGNFNAACAMLRGPLVAHLLRDNTLPVSCVVADACHPWTGGVARDLGVPRFSFDGFCAFSSFCMRQMNLHRIFDGVDYDDDTRPVRVPGFPIHVEISRARSPGNFTGPGMKEFGEEIMAEYARADGMVVNSFAEPEPVFVDAYEAAIGKKIWTVGPLFLMPLPPPVTSEDANAVRCVRWLESKESRSVVFVSFGSLVRSSLPQLVEIAHGLEATRRPFIWAVKPGGDLGEFERWLSEDGFERRVGYDMGLVVTGWAPQKTILSHEATGGFVTHCGWNSVLECLAAGLPMATWPHFAEQFMNEKLVVDVLRVGVAVGVKDAAQWAVEKDEGVVATRQDVERAVAEVMDGGEEGAARRARADELGRKAREAVAPGGSSDRNMALLMEHVEQMKSTV